MRSSGLAFILVVAVCCSAHSAQSPPAKKPIAENPRTPRPSFECPDVEAKQACKSYEELRKAKDTGLPDDGYACFRKNTDEFFVFSIADPFFRKRWDADQKQMVVDTEYTPSGYGFAHAYKNGIQDSTTMPTLVF